MSATVPESARFSSIDSALTLLVADRRKSDKSGESFWAKIYQKFGLRYLLPVTVLIFYSFLGAGVFYATEQKEIEARNEKKLEKIAESRAKIADCQSQMVQFVWEMHLLNYSEVMLSNFNKCSKDTFRLKSEKNQKTL